MQQSDQIMAEIREWAVTGKVQGVAYRAFTRHHANELALRGYARNLADGSVQVVASGTSESLDRFARQLKMGPPAARVDSLMLLETSRDSTRASGFDSFLIR